VCGLHKTRHLYNVVEWLRRRAKTYIYGTLAGLRRERVT
jgi:hypothetical protein